MEVDYGMELLTESLDNILMLRDDPSTAGNPPMLAVAPVKEQCLSKTLGYSLRLYQNFSL